MVVLAALAVMPANAQFKFGVKGGINSSSMKISYEDIVNHSATGWFIGPTVKATFPLGLVNLGADGAVLYDERRSKSGVEGMEQSIKRQSIIIPLNARVSFNFLKVVGAFVSTGPQFGFNVGKSGVDFSSFSSAANSFQLKKSQFSWNVGIGAILFKHLEIGVNYNFDIAKTGELKDMSKSDILASTKQKSVVVSAAYYF